MLSNNINSEDNLTFVAGYNIGGKTGTAQKYGENGQIATGKYISSFIGTYPAKNPEYVMVYTNAKIYYQTKKKLVNGKYGQLSQ